jgi:hypothetical protein
MKLETGFQFDAPTCMGNSTATLRPENREPLFRAPRKVKFGRRFLDSINRNRIELFFAAVQAQHSSTALRWRVRHHDQDCRDGAQKEEFHKPTEPAALLGLCQTGVDQRERPPADCVFTDDEGDPSDAVCFFCPRMARFSESNRFYLSSELFPSTRDSQFGLLSTSILRNPLAWLPDIFHLACFQRC